MASRRLPAAQTPAMHSVAVFLLSGVGVVTAARILYRTARSGWAATDIYKDTRDTRRK